MTSLRRLRTPPLLTLIASVAVAALQPLGAQEQEQGDRTPQTRGEGEQQEELRLEVRGRPPTPQLLTVRSRGETDWTRSIVDLVGHVDPAILGAAPPLELRVVPVQVPTVRGPLMPNGDRPIDEVTDEDSEGPPAGRPGTRDPPDPR